MSSELFLDLSLFERQDLIYRGRNSKIIEVIDRRNIKYAAKVSLKKIDELTRYQLIEISRGLNIILKINHPSILKFIGYSPINYKKRPKPIIIYEFASNSSLDKLIESKQPISNNISILDDTKKLIILYGIASGMSYLHLNNIIHRDLQPNKFFLINFFIQKLVILVHQEKIC